MNTDKQGMRFTLPDQSVCESPTAKDVTAAVAQRPRQNGWMLSLATDDTLLSASIQDGEVCLAVDDEVSLLGAMVPRKSRALEPIDEALLEAVLESYRAGDGRWRQLCRWSTPDDDRKKTHWALMLVVRLWLVVVIIACIPDQYLPDFIPGTLRGTQALLGLFPVTVAGGITWGIAYLLSEKLGLFMRMTSWATR